MLEKHGPTGSPMDAEFFLRSGVEKNVKGDFDGALVDFTEALRRNADLVEGFVYRGIAHLSKGDFQQSLVDFEAAIQRQPGQAWPHGWRGLALMNLGRHQDALIEFNAAIELQSNYLHCYLLRGRLLAIQGNAEEAISDCNQAIQRNPTSSDSFIYRGELYPQSVTDFDDFADVADARKNSVIATAYLQRASAFARLERHAESIRDLTEVIRLQPTNRVAYTERAKVYWKQEEYEPAIADYTHLLNSGGAAPDLYAYRGTLHLHLGNETDALTDFSTAIGLDSTNPDALVGRGQIHHRDGNYQLALADFTTVIEGHPDHVEALWRRGNLLLDLEQDQAAIADFSEAIRREPKTREALIGRARAWDYLGEADKAEADLLCAEDIQLNDEETMPSQTTFISTLLQKHFEPASLGDLTITERRFPVRVRADLQQGINSLLKTLHVSHFCGVRKQNTHQGVSFTDLLVRDRHDPAQSAPPQFEEYDIGEEQPLRCLKEGIWLLKNGDTPTALFLQPQTPFLRNNDIGLQFASLNDEEGFTLSKEFFRSLEIAVQESRSYRGKILSLESRSNFQGTSTGIQVHKLRGVRRDQVILPRQTLELLDRNVIHFVKQRSRLSKLGMATKKGLLFYGPPGTGKTHTLHYLAGALEGTTTLLISAEQVGLLGEYMTLARLLQPSMVVIEDADLIARSRENMGSACEEVLLNKLLNEMDGLREDADILFILTTNRPEAIEAALSSRPGRIDQAVEFPFPDMEGRVKLIELYSQGAEVSDEVVQDIAHRTDQVSAAFIKELMRRSAQFQLERDDSSSISIHDVENALDEMLFKGGSLNRKLLGGVSSDG